MHPSAGGPPVVIERLCQLAPLQGWDASVITTSLYCEDDGETLQGLLRQRIEATVLPIRGPRILKSASGSVETIDKAVGLADIVHLHTLWHPLNAIARKACKRHGRKYVLMPHGMLDRYSLRQRRWQKSIYLAMIERTNLIGARRLIFTTAEEERAAREALPWLPPGQVIPLAADGPSEMSREASAEKFRDQFPQVVGRRCLLFLGRIHKKKGLERILGALPEIARRYPQVLLVVAGQGERRYVQRVKELVRTSNLSNYLLFTGSLAGEAKYGAFASAEVFVLPSSQENFAISMAEAMHMAVPIIVSDKVNSWPFVVEAGAGCVIADVDMELALVQHVDTFLKAPDRAREAGKRGRSFARVHFTWPRVARDMTSLYRQVLPE
jgi:glycosyltransferase involved in cell wall biosynthesis